MLPKLAGVFSDDIAIDLGTANTLVHVAGRGTVIEEPSMVAVRATGGERQIVAVGSEAQRIIGIAPEPLEALFPLREGVIADFIATGVMLREFIRRVRTALHFRRPRILISVPASATPVERRAVVDTAREAGARSVHLIAEPVAALLGAGVPVQEAPGTMVVDIGGGTTDIAIISHGKVITARSLRCAGHAMDEAIIRYVRRRHHLVIGQSSAERIKIEAGTASAAANGRDADIHIRGRDLRRGRFKSVVLGPPHVAEALDAPISEIVEFAQRALEEVPAEVAADINERGIVLTGGGAMLDKLDEELTRRLGIECTLAEDPMRCVIRGAALVLEGLADNSHLFLSPDY